MTIKYDVSCGFFIGALYLVAEFPSIRILLSVFILEGYWILSNAFSAFIEMLMWFLCFILLVWYITLTWVVKPRLVFLGKILLGHGV